LANVTECFYEHGVFEVVHCSAC